MIFLGTIAHVGKLSVIWDNLGVIGKVRHTIRQGQLQWQLFVAIDEEMLITLNELHKLTSERLLAPVVVSRALETIAEKKRCHVFKMIILNNSLWLFT